MSEEQAANSEATSDASSKAKSEEQQTAKVSVVAREENKVEGERVRGCPKRVHRRA